MEFVEISLGELAEILRHVGEAETLEGEMIFTHTYSPIEENNFILYRVDGVESNRVSLANKIVRVKFFDYQESIIVLRKDEYELNEWLDSKGY